MSMPGFWEFAALGVLALLIFGPDKLPGMARTLGRTISQFRREAQGALDELKRAADIEELRKVGEELKATATDFEREAAEAGAAANRPPGGTIAAGSAAALGAAAMSADNRGDGPPDRVMAGPPPFDPEAT